MSDNLEFKFTLDNPNIAISHFMLNDNVACEKIRRAEASE